MRKYSAFQEKPLGFSLKTPIFSHCFLEIPLDFYYFGGFSALLAEKQQNNGIFFGIWAPWPQIT